jgi:hypothetical protein
MLNETPAEPRRTVERLEKQSPTVSSISLPKGGGVIRGMGEKLAAKSVDRHRLHDGPHRHVARSLRLRATFRVFLRLRFR